MHEYVQLVEGHRVDGKVRQRVVATLGRLDELKASGQLDRWAGAFARLDPPPVGTRREVGPLLLVTHYLRRLGLSELVDAAVPMRGRSLLTHGEVISAPARACRCSTGSAAWWWRTQSLVRPFCSGSVLSTG